MTDTLRPCPRHGTSGEIKMYPGMKGEVGAHVGCSLCTMEFPHPARTKKEAAERWNNAYCWNLRDAIVDAQKRQLDENVKLIDRLTAEIKAKDAEIAQRTAERDALMEANQALMKSSDELMEAVKDEKHLYMENEKEWQSVMKAHREREKALMSQLNRYHDDYWRSRTHHASELCEGCQALAAHKEAGK